MEDMKTQLPALLFHLHVKRQHIENKIVINREWQR